MKRVKEREQGWILLFDGETTNGWMTPKKQPLPLSHVQDGSLNPHPCDYMLVHEKEWSDFVLSLEVKISPGCNSGVFFRTSPLTASPGKDVGFNGIELAVDDTETAGFHDTGAIYDLVKPKKNAMKPAGQWNHIVLTCVDNMISITLNDELVTEMNLDEWTEPGKRPDGSTHKFSETAYKNHLIQCQRTKATIPITNSREPLGSATAAAAATIVADLPKLSASRMKSGNCTIPSPSKSPSVQPPAPPKLSDSA